MKYMLMICDDEKSWLKLDDAARMELIGRYRALTTELKASGKYVGGSQLHPTGMATSVRVRDGKRLVTDGPFAETREQLGGYFVVDAKDLDEALGIAARIPAAETGTIEVRPLVDSLVSVPA